MKRISSKFNSKNRRSVKNLNEVLYYLSGDRNLVKSDRAKIMDNTTLKVINKVVPGIRVNNNQLDEKTIRLINEAFIKKKYKEKANIKELQNRLMYFNKRGFLKALINLDEHKNSVMGPSTKDAIKEFQTKYKLKPTGLMNVPTDEKIESVYTSITGTKPEPKKQFKVSANTEIGRIVNKVRLNTSSQQVADLQKALVKLGFAVTNEEASEQRYGASTKKAVDAFQNQHGIAMTGQVDKETAVVINQCLVDKPECLLKLPKMRVRGSVRNEGWEGIGGVIVKVSQQGVGGDLILLGEGKTYPNGFYIISFLPPTVKYNEPINLVVEIKKGRKALMTKEYINVKESLWVNYTMGDAKYLGLSEFEQIDKAINTTIGHGELEISKLVENNHIHDIKYLSKRINVEMTELMKYFIAHRLADRAKNTYLSPEVFYGFMKQNAFGLTDKDLRPKNPANWDKWLLTLENKLLKSVLMMNEVEHESVLQSSFDNNLIPRRLMFM